MCVRRWLVVMKVCTLRFSRFDLVFCDFRMPEINDFQFTHTPERPMISQLFPSFSQQFILIRLWLTMPLPWSNHRTGNTLFPGKSEKSPRFDWVLKRRPQSGLTWTTRGKLFLINTDSLIFTWIEIPSSSFGLYCILFSPHSIPLSLYSEPGISEKWMNVCPIDILFPFTESLVFCIPPSGSLMIFTSSCDLTP